MYEKLITSSIFRDFSRSTTVSRLEFSIYGTFPRGLSLKLLSVYSLKQYPDAVLPALPARCLAED